jgi:hypothetical protein
MNGSRRGWFACSGALLCAAALAFGSLGCSTSDAEQPLAAAGASGSSGTAGAAGIGGGNIGVGGAGGLGVGGLGVGGLGVGGSGAFESDDPSRSGPKVPAPGAGGTVGVGGSPGSGGAPGAGGSSTAVSSNEAERVIAEADIIQVAGDTLYALSEYGGLAVIDVSNPDDLTMLGRHVVHGKPFEMYVKSGVAYAMYSSFPRYDYDAATGIHNSVVSSRVVAIDLRDPAALKELGTFDMPGEISDSRMIGDIMYVVSYENGTCWDCVQNQPRTTVMSIAVADPAAIRKVAELAFADQKGSSSSYRRSVTVTTQRLYVSGMVYDAAWGPDTGHSTIQVVDISDPAGTLVAGATVPVNGQIESRWQMDEYQGVLRVVSQSGSTWANGPAPVVETFRVQSAQVLQPLGKLALTLPARENLKSARFDGPRGYAVTFLQTDPLFTIDLSDPAAPKQAGEIQMPGYLYYLEPRGDRVVALGIDNNDTANGLTVTIFDVANIYAPTLLSRANFGGRRNWTLEDQNRIHKAFRLFDAEGLIVVPFDRYSPAAGMTWCDTYLSSVQLLDFTRDTVTARGVVPVRGEAKRAFPYKSRLFAVSDDEVATFDITDRDAPVRKAALALAIVVEKTARVGEYLVELVSTWWTSAPQIAVVPIAAGPQDVANTMIDLAKAVNTTDEPCVVYRGGFSARSLMLVNGSLVYLIWDARFMTAAARGRVGFAVIDLTDPLAPVLKGSSVLEIARPPATTNYDYGQYGTGIEYFPAPTGVWSSGSRIARVGNTVVLEEVVAPEPYDNFSPSQAILHAIDLSDPANIRRVSSTPIAEGPSTSGLFADGTAVYTSHKEDVVSNPGRTRFFVDRFDYSNLAAPVRTKTNVPGSLLGVDTGGRRVVTIDYARTATLIANTSNPGIECQASATGIGDAWVQYNTTVPEYCVRFTHTLKLVDLGQNGATLLDTFVPQGTRPTSIAMGADRLWIVRSHYSDNHSDEPIGLDTVTGIRAGKFALASSLATSGDWVTTQPDGALVSILSPDSPPYDFRVYDTADPANPRLAVGMGLQDLRPGGGFDVTLDDKYAVLTMGRYGAQAFAIK